METVKEMESRCEGQLFSSVSKALGVEAGPAPACLQGDQLALDSLDFNSPHKVVITNHSRNTTLVPRVFRDGRAGRHS